MLVGADDVLVISVRVRPPHLAGLGPLSVCVCVCVCVRLWCCQSLEGGSRRVLLSLTHATSVIMRVGVFVLGEQLRSCARGE